MNCTVSARRHSMSTVEYIEKDAALERRFQPVMVDEPTVEDTISILRGLKERYEVFHGVKITDCCAGIARQCCRTVIFRIVSCRIKRSTLWMRHVRSLRQNWILCRPNLDELHRRIMQMEIEEDGT